VKFHFQCHVTLLIAALTSLGCAQSAQPSGMGGSDRVEELDKKSSASQVMPDVASLPDGQRLYQSAIGESTEFTWWLPRGADAYVLPISAGVVVDASRSDLMGWLCSGSPWSLTELPVVGARYGNQTLVLIVPSPHYAELVVGDRIGVRVSFSKTRPPDVPCEIVAIRRAADPLEVAKAFREWRTSAASIGEIPRRRPLEKKIADNEKVGRLLGAPHFYLWGPALFSKHDIQRNKWVSFAKALRDSPARSFGNNLVKSFAEDQRSALQELAKAEWPMDCLTVAVAGAIDTALCGRDLLKLAPGTQAAEVIRQNQKALADQFATFVNHPASWGDGLSNTLLDSLREAGIDRALLVLSDLYGRSFRPDVVAHAEELGFLVGPYDSYHCVHSPKAEPNDTWETAQFDLAAYGKGRVINADGTGHAGFKGHGYHFSPQAAWPHFQERIDRIVAQVPYSAWFIDCDATAECFDDFSPDHPATRIDDTRLRRRRLSWLETKHRMVVGSEGGSVLFADVIDFGHGVQTPYIGHLDPSFENPDSPSFVGEYWPPDRPDVFFKPVPVPPGLKTPYFDPTVRIPLYQAALGDELIASHHWSFDSLKFSDVQQTRELMEILYMVPPIFHVSRETWPKRREHIIEHHTFWSPLHRELACAPLSRFQHLSDDRLVQRTTFETRKGEVSITVNFGERAHAAYPPHSATVAGAVAVPAQVYEAKP
jgi:hypothetical protein